MDDQDPHRPPDAPKPDANVYRGHFEAELATSDDLARQHGPAMRFYIAAHGVELAHTLLSRLENGLFYRDRPDDLDDWIDQTAHLLLRAAACYRSAYGAKPSLLAMEDRLLVHWPGMPVRNVAPHESPARAAHVVLHVAVADTLNHLADLTAAYVRPLFNWEESDPTELVGTHRERLWTERRALASGTFFLPDRTDRSVLELSLTLRRAGRLYGLIFDSERWILQRHRPDENLVSFLMGRPKDLNVSEQAIVDTLLKEGARLTTDALLKKALGRTSGHGKGLLASLVKRQIITTRQDVKPPGYGLPEWDRPGRSERGEP